MKRSADRSNFYSGITITAIEGGVYTWADVRDYNHADENNVTAMVRDYEDPEEPWTLIDNDAIASALCKLKDGKVQTRRGQKFWSDVYRTMEGADIDAEDADVIVQVACYGSIVFG
tara:strand:+ start:177 stop:524 length:348 start_codon:yes stop_codon:yes gene_type:complete